MAAYRDLIVWQKAMILVEEVYQLTRQMPKEELYGLASQMRRAAVSIPSNIAEGSRRKAAPEYLQFLRVADGSGSELETQLLIAERIYHAQIDDALNLLHEVQRMLFGIKKAVAVRK